MRLSLFSVIINVFQNWQLFSRVTWHDSSFWKRASVQSDSSSRKSFLCLPAVFGKSVSRIGHISSGLRLQPKTTQKPLRQLNTLASGCLQISCEVIFGQDISLFGSTFVFVGRANSCVKSSLLPFLHYEVFFTALQFITNI